MYKSFLLKSFTLLAFLTFSFTVSYGQVPFTITSPDEVAGSYFAAPAQFGSIITEGISGDLVFVMDSTTAATGCGPLTNDLTGAIAVADRGVCSFVQKALNAQAAGAIALIICNNDTTNAVFNAAGADPNVTIPVMMVSYGDCQTFRTAIPGATATLGVTPRGLVCSDAIDVPGEGTYTVDTLVGVSAPFAEADGAIFYKFTAPADTLVTVDACTSGPDTRLVILDGCGYGVIAFNDDCDTDNEIFGSGVSFLAQAGVTYYIYWDDRWDASGFDWTLSYESLPTVAITFQVDMSFEDVADTVILAYGSPDATTLADVGAVGMTDEDGDGVYTATIEVTSLDTIIYAFVNGPLAPGSIEVVPDECGADTGLGFNVRGIVATTIEDATIGVVCFSGCTTCAVTDCEEPRVFINDDFEGYELGALGPQADFWTTWSGTEGGAEDGIVSADTASSGSQSMLIDGNNGPQDVLLLLGDKSTGHYILSWNMYVENNRRAYYNIQGVEGAPGDTYVMQVAFGVDGTASLDAGAAAAATFEYPQGEWFEVRHVIDIDNDIIRMYVADQLVYTWPFSWTTFETTGGGQLGSIDFYPAAGPHVFYVDDIYYAEIPAATEGYYCYTAEEIEPGTHTVPELSCFGAGLAAETSGINATASYWYSYTPTEDGYISVGSCENGGVDTRVWILEGDCYDFVTHGMNDDQCLDGSGTDYASYKEVAVTAGTTYYIMWDNVWDDRGFDFDLTFSSDALPEGDFCSSAIAIEPGVHTVDSINGHAAVTGPLIGLNQTNFPTGYMQSEWYSFTPSEDGEMVVTSCDFANDTRLYVYDGSCDSYATLNLLARNDDCDGDNDIFGSEVRVPVTAGTTYYIEWDDRWYGDAFDFELRFGPPAVEVTFQVDVSILAANGELEADGMFIAGEFNNFANAAMTDEGDNIWSYTTTLAQGDTIEYKFKNGADGWEEIDTSVGDDCTLGGFGNRFIVPGSANTTLDPVCFGYCVSCAVVGTEDPAFSAALNVFPNPAKEVTNIQYNFDQATDLQIRMTNSLGQVLFERKVNNAISGNEEISVSNLAAGMYFLYITDGNRAKTETLVIQK